MTSGSSPELHLFILWSAALAEQDRVMADLASRFEVVQNTMVTWSPGLFAENMTRFYGLSLPPGSFKEEHVGVGPFRLVVVRDASPVYADVPTSKGLARVNAAVFEAKTRYREWTGGGHRIHSTNTPAEFEHDICLLLGMNTADYELSLGSATPPSELNRDLTGASGWTDLRELFYVLNSTIRYIVLRNYDPLPDDFYSGEHGDIDLLVHDYDEAAFILGASKVFDEPHRIHVRVAVAGSEVLFDLRFVGDDYYDRAWEDSLLASTARFGMIRIPEPDNHFYSLLYHALIHKRDVAADYVRVFERSHPALVGDDGALDLKRAARLLGGWMARHRYALTVAEPSVYFNPTNAQLVRRGMWRARPARFAVRLTARAVKRALGRGRSA